MENQQQKTLKTNTSSYTPIDKCPACQGSGWFEFTDDHGYLMTKKCACRIQNEVMAHMVKSGIGAGFLDRRFDNFEMPTAEYRKIAELSYRFKNDESAEGILLCGQIGSGKTHLGVAILNEWMKQGRFVRFYNYADLVRELSRNAQDGKFDEIMHYAKTSSRIMIDDLFKANIRETHVNFMYEIINTRYENGLKTVFTSEKSLGQILTIDEGVGSRIAEMCKGYVISMDKLTNYRLKGNA